MTFAFLSCKTESSFLSWVCTVIDQSGTTEAQSSVPFVIRSDDGLTLETSAFKLFTVANLRYQLTLLYSHQCSTTNSFETYPFYSRNKEAHELWMERVIILRSPPPWQFLAAHPRDNSSQPTLVTIPRDSPPWPFPATHPCDNFSQLSPFPQIKFKET